jgi:predicted nucleic acid-binding Zn ribbon protein
MRSRPPRNYSGTENPAKKLADLLPEMMQEIGRKAKDQSEEVFREWFELVGEKMAPMTKPVSLIDGVLTVHVKSATLYSLLCQHEKGRLLGQLQKKFSIRNLIFRVG